MRNPAREREPVQWRWKTVNVVARERQREREREREREAGGVLRLETKWENEEKTREGFFVL